MKLFFGMFEYLIFLLKRKKKFENQLLYINTIKYNVKYFFQYIYFSVHSVD